MRVVITGASGLVGRALASALVARGDSVVRLVRRASATPTPSDEALWNPVASQIDVARVAGADAIVNLAGESIAAGRWTDARKQSIRDSRVKSTDLIARAAATSSSRPRVFLSASAVGYYGAHDATPLDETAASGSDFLASVCRDWESAARPASDAGVRVVTLRIGLVLSARGGALAKMVPIFRMGMGGVVGSGTQFMSWISLTDLLRVFLFAIDTDAISGPVNVVTPHAVSNREFTTMLGRVLSRPTLIPAPAFAIRTVLGEMGDALLLSGANVFPKRLLDAGFSFTHPYLEGALRHELGLPR